MDLFILSLLIMTSIIISGFISMKVIGPNLVGFFDVFISLICGAPIAYIIFFNSVYKCKVHGKVRFALPALIPIIIAIALIGWSLYDQNPEVMFKRLLSDPIPSGVSNIRAKDISTFSVVQMVAFDVTPQAIDQIIAKNELKLVDDCPGVIPLMYFPEIQQDQDWLCYSKTEDNGTHIWEALWVNDKKSSAVFRLDFGG
jgi:hypothetical protein